jgi:hypothetical protein
VFLRRCTAARLKIVREVKNNTIVETKVGKIQFGVVVDSCNAHRRKEKDNGIGRRIRQVEIFMPPINSGDGRVSHRGQYRFSHVKVGGWKIRPPAFFSSIGVGIQEFSAAPAEIADVLAPRNTMRVEAGPA